MKLNTDGSANGNPGLAGCGGVIRDDARRWIVVFEDDLNGVYVNRMCPEPDVLI